MNKYIEPLNMNGLRGRMLRMASNKSKKQEILLMYGHHSSLERMFSFAEVLSNYGSVTMPDLPGFGGMDAFYKTGQVPTLDAYADYVAAFMKLRYKRKKVIVVGFSYSVPIIIRTLQKYPELAKNIQYVVSIVGFSHREDFHYPKNYIRGLKVMTAVGSRRVPAFIMRHTAFTSPVIRSMYWLVADKHAKMKDGNRKERKERIDFEIELWRKNDLRTWMKTLGDMFDIDLCSQQVKAKAYHVFPEHDVYFDKNVVEQHMKIIFEDVEVFTSPMPNHAPSIIASEEEAERFMPGGLLKLLASS